MKHTYKNDLFTELAGEERGVCGIKLPVMVQVVPQQAIEMIVVS